MIYFNLYFQFIYFLNLFIFKFQTKIIDFFPQKNSDHTVTYTQADIMGFCRCISGSRSTSVWRRSKEVKCQQDEVNHHKSSACENRAHMVFHVHNL